MCQACNESFESLFPLNDLSDFASLDPYSRVPDILENRPRFEAVFQVFEVSRRVSFLLF